MIAPHPNGAAQRELLTSAIVDLSALSEVHLQLRHQVSAHDAQDRAVVETSTDGGTTWTALRAWRYETAAEIVRLDAPDLAGATAARLRFRIEGPGTAFWAVDEIQLIGR